ncbi:MAG: DUF5677 domain-containing protein [Endomicrobiaceae bacterium]|nr:DUF5677 domain-containing protein [Endomicrobiaceae bacterium]
MTDFTIDNKIQIIRNFVPVPKPQFEGNENATRYIIWNLYNRVCEAVKSFVILLDNQRYYDAFIIAGHALETCSILSYIKDNDTEAAKLENYNKYIAQSSVARLIAILEMDSNLEKDYARNAYEIVLQIFCSVENTVFKYTQNTEEKHKEIIEEIKSLDEISIGTIKSVKNFYKLPRIRDYITAFSKKMGNINDKEIFMYYTKYCDYKHSNMLAPGVLAGDIDAEEIDWFIELVQNIVQYLEKSKIP